MTLSLLLTFQKTLFSFSRHLCRRLLNGLSVDYFHRSWINIQMKLVCFMIEDRRIIATAGKCGLFPYFIDPRTADIFLLLLRTSLTTYLTFFFLNVCKNQISGFALVHRAADHRMEPARLSSPPDCNRFI